MLHVYVVIQSFSQLGQLEESSQVLAVEGVCTVRGEGVRERGTSESDTSSICRVMGA